VPLQIRPLQQLLKVPAGPEHALPSPVQQRLFWQECSAGHGLLQAPQWTLLLLVFVQLGPPQQANGATHADTVGQPGGVNCEHCKPSLLVQASMTGQSVI
jgi:hypothetical protein